MSYARQMDRYSVYKTRLWKETRKAVIERDRAICHFCGKIITHRPTVHHLQELDEHNFRDFDIAFNMDNLVACHNYCHDEYHQRFGYKETIVNNDLTIDYSRRRL